MYLDKENLSKIRRFCYTNTVHHNEYCLQIREIVENSNTKGRIYQTFWINKDKPKQRAFSNQEALRFQNRRRIDYPRDNVKADCQKINNILQKMLKNVPWLHGFMKNRNIYTNAMAHAQINPLHMINMDLENAFHQVNFKNLTDIGEIVFGFTKSTARKFAKMLSFKNKMVQGNPASPMILNLIGLTLDVRLYALAKAQGFRYTRYADDITLSSAKHFSFSFIKFVNSIIAEQRFTVNTKKTKIYRNIMEITGIKVYHGKWCITKRRSFKKDENGNFTFNKKYKKFLRQLTYLEEVKKVTHWHLPEGTKDDYFSARNEGFEGTYRNYLDANYPTLKGIRGGIKAWLFTDWKKIQYKWLEGYKPCRAKMKGWRTNYNWIKKERTKEIHDKKLYAFQSDELIYLQEYRNSNGSQVTKQLETH